MNDWLGKSTAVLRTICAANNSHQVREDNDFYATDPIVIDWLFKIVPELMDGSIWEPAAGHGHLAKRINEISGVTCKATELINRSTGEMLIDGCEFGVDFLTAKFDEHVRHRHIITNPPYRFAEKFIRKSIDILNSGNYVCMFLPIRYTEGKGRRKLFDEFPPKIIVVSSSRIQCAMNGKFEIYGSSAQSYAWFIWQVGYVGKTEFQWFN